MEIVQTCTGRWPWCMGMFGARFAVFVRRARVLPSPCPATRNLSFWRFHRHCHPVVSTRCFTGLVRVGVKIPQDGNRANKYGRVAMVHVHVWRTVCTRLCSVCSNGQRVESGVAIQALSLHFDFTPSPLRWLPTMWPLSRKHKMEPKPLHDMSV